MAERHTEHFKWQSESVTPQRSGNLAVRKGLTASGFQRAKKTEYWDHWCFQVLKFTFPYSNSHLNFKYSQLSTSLYSQSWALSLGSEVFTLFFMLMLTGEDLSWHLTRRLNASTTQLCSLQWVTLPWKRLRRADSYWVKVGWGTTGETIQLRRANNTTTVVSKPTHYSLNFSKSCWPHWGHWRGGHVRASCLMLPTLSLGLVTDLDRAPSCGTTAHSERAAGSRSPWLAMPQDPPGRVTGSLPGPSCLGEWLHQDSAWPGYIKELCGFPSRSWAYNSPLWLTG